MSVGLSEEAQLKLSLARELSEKNWELESLLAEQRITDSKVRVKRNELNEIAAKLQEIPLGPAGAMIIDTGAWNGRDGTRTVVLVDVANGARVITAQGRI